MVENNLEWEVVAAMVANNSTVVFEAMIEDKLIVSVAGSVANRRAIDFDC